MQESVWAPYPGSRGGQDKADPQITQIWSQVTQIQLRTASVKA